MSQKSCDLCCPYCAHLRLVPQGPISSLKNLTGKIHFTRLIFFHLFLLNQSPKRAEASTEPCGRENEGRREGR